MYPNGGLAEQMHPEAAAVPGVGALAGAYVSLAGFDRCSIVIHVDDAAEELTVDLNQATDTSGTSTKALTIKNAWVKLDAATTYTLTAVSAATMTIASGEAGIVVIEVEDAELDVNNSFATLSADVAGSTARVVSVVYMLRGSNYNPAGGVAV